MEAILKSFLVLASVVYSLLEALKPIYDPEKRVIGKIDSLVAIAFGIALCWFAKFNLLSLAGLYVSPVQVGYVLTGILAGGAVGAGMVHDFPGFLRALFKAPPAAA